MNVITKTPDKSHGSIETSIGNEGYKKYATTVGTDKIEISTSKEYYGAQARTSPDRIGRDYYNTRNKGYAHNIAVNVKPHDYVTINYMRQQSDSAYGQISTIPKAKWTAKKSALTETKYWHYRDIKNNGSIVYDDTTTKATLFFNTRRLVGESNSLANPKYVQSPYNYGAYKVGTEAQHTWKLHGDTHKAVLGVMGVHEAYQGISDANKKVKADRNIMALYGNYEFQITPSFSTTIGGRYQVINDPINNQNVFTPQWQTLYKIDKSRSMYTNVGKAFTMPNIHDAFKKGSNGYQIIPGGDLKPEEGWNYEIGYKQSNKRDSWRVSVYHMRFKNFFDWAMDPTDGKKTIRINGGEFRNTGIEAEYKSYVTSDLIMTLGASYSNPQKQEIKATNWVQTAPKLELNAAFDYEKDKWQAGLAASYWGIRAFNRDGKRNPEFINVNAHVNYSPNESQTIGFYVNNVLNRQNVISQGDWEYWDLPRNYYVNYSYRF